MARTYLTVTESAARADVTRNTIYRWVQKGVTYRGEYYYLNARLLDGEYFIEERDLDSFLYDIGYDIEDN
jgi:hypothetical protein